MFWLFPLRQRKPELKNLITWRFELTTTPHSYCTLNIMKLRDYPSSTNKGSGQKRVYPAIFRPKQGTAWNQDRQAPMKPSDWPAHTYTRCWPPNRRVYPPIWRPAAGVGVRWPIRWLHWGLAVLASGCTLLWPKNRRVYPFLTVALLIIPHN